jgi:hypothetical protein
MTGFRVLLSPATAWDSAAKSPDRGRWLSTYLLLVVVTGCSASLMTAGRVTLRIALPCMVYTAIVPALQIGSLAPFCRGVLPVRRAAALFSLGNLLWMAALLAFAVAWAWAPAPFLYRRLVWARTIAAYLLVAYSGYVDYWFFRRVLGRERLAAARDLAIQRSLCWIPALTIWVGPAGWQMVGSVLGL